MKGIKLEAPTNNIIVKVKTKYIGNISRLLQLSAIQNGASVDSVDLVNIMGEVVGLPRKIQNEKIGYKGFSAEEIQVGDTAIFSYNIIHDFKIVEQGAEQVYRNRFFYKGEEYFVADITKVFGVIRDNEIKMINGFMMLGDFTESTIILPQSLKKIKKASESYVQHIGSAKTHEKGIDLETDDVVYFSGSSSQKYQINDKKFSIIQQGKIFGKKIED